MHVDNIIVMPNEKSIILNKKRTLLIVLGVLLALLITLKSDQLFSFNISAPVTIEDTYLETEESLSYLFNQIKGLKSIFSEAQKFIQGLQN